MPRTLHPDGNRIRTLRLERGWPQEQLASIADLSPRTIQRVEAGGNASYETLRSIACAFEVEAKELLMEQPETVAPQFPESPGHGAEIAEPNPRVPNGDRMFKIMNRGLWAGLLMTAIACLAYVQFLSRSPGTGSAAVASNSFQEPSSALPAGEGAAALERQVTLRPESIAAEKRPQRRRRTIKAVESSPALPVHDTSPPNLGTSASVLSEDESQPSAPQPSEQLVEEVAASNPIVSPADCDDVTPQPAASPEAQSRKAMDHRSLSDAAVRFSKRTSGFFTRLGAAMKTSF
jgi:transcriptional regulator with XRE-family HTH domain